MKEDYLWDKTGKNPEIENLENALKAFRYQETAPPEIPAKIIAFEPKHSRRFFRFAFVFAACSAVVVTSLGIWLQVSKNQLHPSNEVAKIIMPLKDTIIETQNDPPINVETADLPIGKIDTYQPKRKPILIKTRKTVPLKTSVKSFKSKDITVRLTKEEQFAYDQLMLALSITSSKLRLVKDKVDGIEEQNAVIETEDKYTRRK